MGGCAGTWVGGKIGEKDGRRGTERKERKGKGDMKGLKRVKKEK